MATTEPRPRAAAASTLGVLRDLRIKRKSLLLLKEEYLRKTTRRARLPTDVPGGGAVPTSAVLFFARGCDAFRAGGRCGVTVDAGRDADVWGEADACRDEAGDASTDERESRTSSTTCDEAQIQRQPPFWPFFSQTQGLKSAIWILV